MHDYRRQDYFADRTLNRYGAPLVTTEPPRFWRIALRGMVFASLLSYATACAVAIVTGLI